MTAPFTPTMVATATRRDWHLRSEDGETIALDVGRWHAEPSGEELPILDLALDAALDVGCGPGRHTVALRERGIRVLGIDVATAAVQTARARGANAVVRSVFDPLPRGWGSALLLDGNIGIGGDPHRLLRRIRALVRDDGRVLVEANPPGVSNRGQRVRIERDGRSMGPWFDWARVGIDQLASVAEGTGFAVTEVLCGDTRWFARLDAR